MTKKQQKRLRQKEWKSHEKAPERVTTKQQRQYSQYLQWAHATYILLRGDYYGLDHSAPHSFNSDHV